MPIWLSDNFISTIRYFNRFISFQGQESVYVLFRKWAGDMVSGVATGFTLNTSYNRYEFNLYEPSSPLSGGKPKLSSLEMTLDGVAMTPVFQYDKTTSDLYYYVVLDMGGPKSSDTYGTIIVGFNDGFDPTGHVIGYKYEEMCHCMDVGEESFQPVVNCTTCYGTGYVGGYIQYTSGPYIECGRIIKPANTILCRFPITSESVKIGRYGGEIITGRKSWTTAGPLLHDYDILIRLRAFGAPININPETLTIPNERYFITEWENSSARPSYDLPLRAQPNMRAVDKGITLHQKFTSQEIQPEHIAYQIPFTM